MRTSKFYLLAATFLLSGTLANAQLTGKETLEDKLYESSKGMPGDEWESLVLDSDVSAAAGTASAAIKEGKLNIKGGGDSKFSQAAFYTTNSLMDGFVLDPNKGYTIEIKAKVAKAKEYGAFTLQGFDMEGKGFRLGIYEDAITESTNPLAKTNSLKDKLDNTDDFHIYRLAVQANGNVSVFRDGEAVGTFKLTQFQYDNLFTNGGFEDSSDKLDDAANFSKFLTDQTMNLVNTEDDQEGSVKTGEYALFMYNEGSTNNKNADDETVGLGYAKTVDFPVKVGSKYALSYDTKRYVSGVAWRDNGLFYDFQRGTQAPKKDYRNKNVFWSDSNTDGWATRSASFTAEDATWKYDDEENKDEKLTPKSVRFEFPTWAKDAVTDSKHVFDNFYMYENLGLQKGVKLGTPENAFPEIAIPAYATNLITEFDPGFEVADPTADDYKPADYDPKNADDKAKSWTNADGWVFAAGNDGLAGAMESKGFYSKVRIQMAAKEGDTNADQVAHTGKYSLRASSLTSEKTTAKGAQRLQYRKQLEPNKTYRFNYWFRNANYQDAGSLIFKLAETLAPGGQYDGDPNASDAGTDLTEGIDIAETFATFKTNWTNDEVEFTTTATNTVFVITSRRPNQAAGKDWHHIYLDDLFLYEVKADQEEADFDPADNILVNGGFEDITKDVMGNDYDWALASYAPDPSDNNWPVKYSKEWGGYVRLQDVNKTGSNDTYFKWANSGKNSLRLSYLKDNETNFVNNMANFLTKAPEGFSYDYDPDTDGYLTKQNFNFEVPLEIGETYTFRFWFKTANYPDTQAFYVANGEIDLWGGRFGKEVNWRQYSITFTTTESNHTLRFYTKFTDWYNFYLDDLELYKHETALPFEGGDSFLQFGKSTGTEETDVTIEYVAFDNTGAYAPYIPAADATLKTLKVNGVVVKDFSADKLTYEIKYRQGWTIPTDITFELNDAKATAGTPVLPTSFESGKNVYKVKVIAEDGVTEKEYTITFTQWAVGMDDVDATIYAYVENGTLNVSGAAAGEVIAVYSVAGQLVAQTTDTAIALDAKGTYFVKVAGQVLTVVY